jgi:hypothetical protein
LALLGLINPRACVVLTFAYLALLGDVRRIISMGALGMGAGSDPLVLVSPVVVLLLTATAFMQNRLTRSTPLSRIVFILLVIMAIQALNPLQGGVVLGLTGVLCIMVPMCWFWVGQSWGSHRFTEGLLFHVVVPIAIAEGVFGLVQVFTGRPQYQEAWVQAWYAGRSLSPDAARPFGSFTAVSEFTKYLSVGIILLVASAIGGRFRLSLFGLPALVVALFLASARGPIVGCCGAMVFLWAMLSRSRSGWIWRAALASACLFGGLVWTLNEVHTMDVSPELEYLVKHQTEGLLNPLDEQKSTASGHLSSAVFGFGVGLSNPLGQGLGRGTHIARAFGGQTIGTEVDLSNMFACLGIVGGATYLLLYFRVFRHCVKLWNRDHRRLTLGITGVLLVLAMNWLNTGEYTTISLAWFCIGAIDHQFLPTLAPTPAPAPAGQGLSIPSPRLLRMELGVR